MSDGYINVGDDVTGSSLPGTIHPVATKIINGKEYQHIVSGLVPELYDAIDLSYTGSNLTGVVYKLSGTTVATLTLSYDGSDNLTGVVKT